MPDGKKHNTINITALIIILSGLYVLFSRYDVDLYTKYSHFQLVSIFSFFYLFGTFFLSPDLDIHSSAYERWGPIKILWLPYKTIFKHRGLSHHPVFGPLTIFLNFGLIVIPVILLTGFNLYLVPFEILTVLILGIWTSIELHILADMVVSDLS